MWRPPIQNHPKPSITEKRRNKAKYLTGNSIKLQFVKKTSMPNSVESLEYIKCLSSPRPFKGPSISIRYNCHKICSWSRRHTTTLKIRKKRHFTRWSTILLFASFSKIRVLRKVFSKQFCFIRCRKQHLRAVELAIYQKSREPSFREVMDSFVLLAYASLAASRTLLQWLLACLNFTLDSEDLFCWCKRKKWFLWTMAAAQAADNHGDKWGLTWYLRWGIYTSIQTWTHSQNSAEAPSWKISSNGISFKWSRRPSQSARE